MNGSVNKRGFRAVGIVEALEENLDRPILTANQVAFWQALALSGSSQPTSATGGYLASGCRSHNSRKPLGFRGGGRR
jgi:maleate cis-trans isomerase